MADRVHLISRSHASAAFLKAKCRQAEEALAHAVERGLIPIRHLERPSGGLLDRDAVLSRVRGLQVGGIVGIDEGPAKDGTGVDVVPLGCLERLVDSSDRLPWPRRRTTDVVSAELLRLSE